MDRQQSGSTRQDPAVGEVQESLVAPAEGLELRLKAERVQQPQTVVAAGSIAFVCEIALSRPQPVTIDLPDLAILITLHGEAAQAAKEESHV